MKNIFILLTLIFTPLSAIAECLFIEDESSIRNLSELRKMAHTVMDAEGNNCDHHTDLSIRSACQCNYREKPLIQFRISYNTILEKNPNYSNRMICYAKNNQGISINFTAYNRISSWCM